jgi:acyl carrier protein
MSKKPPRLFRFSQVTRSCPAEHFLADLGLAGDTKEASAALAIRRVIADLAEMHEDAIWAHHSFSEDLGDKGAWDSLDDVEFIMSLEAELHARIPDAVAERLPGSDSERLNPMYTVGDMVLGIVATLNEHGILPEKGKT